MIPGVYRPKNCRTKTYEMTNIERGELPKNVYTWDDLKSFETTYNKKLIPAVINQPKPDTNQAWNVDPIGMSIINLLKQKKKYLHY